MAVYNERNEMEKILLDQGYKDFTPSDLAVRSKKVFKKSKSAVKEIYFDYENVYFIKDHAQHKIDSINELVNVLFYFDLKPHEAKDFEPYAEILTSEKFDERIESLGKELSSYKKYNLHKQSQIKIARILDNYKKLQNSINGF